MNNISISGSLINKNHKGMIFVKVNKRDSKQVILIAILPILFIIAIISVTTIVRELFDLSPDSVISTAISILEAIGLVVSLIIAIHQLSDSKEITRATFLTELNKAFVENDDYLDLYNKLQNCLDDCCGCPNKCKNRIDLEAKCNLDVLKGQISNYLTFFETIYILLKNDVISFRVLDDLFAYRFFLVVHSKVVQQKKIKQQPFNFKNIFCLEKEWLMWRKNNGKDKDPSVMTIYNCLQLKELVSPKDYLELTSDRK